MSTVPLECLDTYACCENYMSSFSAFVLNLSKSGHFFFLDQWLMEIVCSAQHQLSLVGDNSLVCANLECSDGSCWASCLNATYYAQHPESVYGISQSVIGGQLLSTYKTVFEQAQGLWDSKTSYTKEIVFRNSFSIFEHLLTQNQTISAWKWFPKIAEQKIF